MAFCENCGRPLADGEVCKCKQVDGAQQAAPVQAAEVRRSLYSLRRRAGRDLQS